MAPHAPKYLRSTATDLARASYHTKVRIAADALRSAANEIERLKNQKATQKKNAETNIH